LLILWAVAHQPEDLTTGTSLFYHGATWMQVDLEKKRKTKRSFDEVIRAEMKNQA
jgi:hypothetical protein